MEIKKLIPYFIMAIIMVVGIMGLFNEEVNYYVSNILNVTPPYLYFGLDGNLTFNVSAINSSGGGGSGGVTIEFNNINYTPAKMNTSFYNVSEMPTTYNTTVANISDFPTINNTIDTNDSNNLININRTLTISNTTVTNAINALKGNVTALTVWNTSYYNSNATLTNTTALINASKVAVSFTSMNCTTSVFNYISVNGTNESITIYGSCINQSLGTPVNITLVTYDTIYFHASDEQVTTWALPLARTELYGSNNTRQKRMLNDSVYFRISLGQQLSGSHPNTAKICIGYNNTATIIENRNIKNYTISAFSNLSLNNECLGVNMTGAKTSEWFRIKENISDGWITAYAEGGNNSNIILKYVAVEVAYMKNITIIVATVQGNEVFTQTWDGAGFASGRAGETWDYEDVGSKPGTVTSTAQMNYDFINKVNNVSRGVWQISYSCINKTPAASDTILTNLAISFPFRRAATTTKASMNARLKFGESFVLGQCQESTLSNASQLKINITIGWNRANSTDYNITFKNYEVFDNFTDWQDVKLPTSAIGGIMPDLDNFRGWVTVTAPSVTCGGAMPVTKTLCLFLEGATCEQE